MGISLDSADEREHDRRRGREGAFRAAAQALAVAAEAGLYPYVVSVAVREFLEPGRFYPFMQLARDLGALEVHLLEPCPTGRIAGRTDLVLTAAERRQIIAYQHAVAEREDLPILSTFTYLEGPDAFGCGAGLTHIYIDGSGELCPCNLVPLSFGNVAREPLEILLHRMRQHFRHPRPTCVGRTLTPHIRADVLPTAPDISCAICEQHLPEEHELPEFFRIREKAREAVGTVELAQAYDKVHEDYDDFWTVEAGAPVRELIQRLPWQGTERVFEAGCGSGFATVLLAEKLTHGGTVTAVDISEGMQLIARRRVQARRCATWNSNAAMPWRPAVRPRLRSGLLQLGSRLHSRCAVPGRREPGLETGRTTGFHCSQGEFPAARVRACSPSWSRAIPRCC